MKKIVLIFLLLLITVNQNFAQWYIATNGDDNNPGTIDSAFATFPKAILEANAGDTIYVRGGVYNLTNTITITAVKNGSDSLFYTLKAYNNEVPVLDFSSQSFGSKGISLQANYWHIKGLQVKGAGDNGMNINFGSNNIIEQCQFYENRDTGLQLSNGSANNKIINCDSYYNADPPDYGDADGFAPKLTCGSGNYFYGCRAWVNCDDGWDGYLRGADDITTTLENCWTWGNGYLPDGTNPGPQANGNGFKMGGGDNSNSDLLMHHNILINCVAFNNKNKGFDQNNNVGSMTLYNCSGFGNLTANYRIQRSLNPGQTLEVKNCVSYNGNVQLGSFAIQETNSWLSPFVVTTDDFISLNSDSASTMRQFDGSLPEIDFLHLAQRSDLIDAGVNLGYPYNGQAPDLGAFESDFTTFINNYAITYNYQLFQNYPNPFNPSTSIKFTINKAGSVSLDIYNISGQKIETLIKQKMAAGNHEVVWDASNMVSGVYFYTLKLNNVSNTKRMLLIQ
jgi:hypothetical protein